MASVDDLMKLAIEKQKEGDIFGATSLFGEVLEIDPNNAEALHLLGLVYYQHSRPDTAETLFLRALNLEPDNPSFLDSLGNAVMKLKRMDEAEQHFRRSVELEPFRPPTWMNLGLLLWQKGDVDEAVDYLNKALEQDPDYPQAHNNMAVIQQRRDHFDEAMFHYQRALELSSELPDPYQNLAVLQKEMGLIAESEATYKLARIQFPDHVHTHRGYLSLLNYLPDLRQDDFFDAHKAYAQSLPSPEDTPPPFANTRDGDRRLRVGYVSSDFRVHPVARNLMPILAAHDRTKVEVFCYGDIMVPDPMTAKIKGMVEYWRDIKGMPDNAVSDTIRQDQIDIVVILAGHFDSNKMGLPKFKPAPICISFHDVSTSGLEEMDYLISDRTLSPKNSPELFTERPLRLPSFYLHPEIDGSPNLSPPPSAENGFITFGAFNAPSKINTEVLTLWANVLMAVPNSKILFKYRKSYDSETVRERIVNTLKARGVDETRIIFKEGMDHLCGHMEVLAESDIALDTFPFSGSTTTFECLWMGLPVVTLPGDTMVSRWTASMEKALHMDDLVASDESDFVRIASDLAADPDRLADIRANLREQLLASPLCNGPLRTRQIERLYRAIWRRWVNNNNKDT